MRKSIAQKVTIGVPAHNEEGNIGLLLTDIYDQQIDKNYDLELVVVLDRCTDDTIDIISSFQNKLKIKILQTNDQSGYGLASGQNLILQNTKRDSLLILLNADIRIQNKNFIQEIVNEILKGSDLVSVRAHPNKPMSYFQKILFTGHIFKWDIFEKWKDGHNLYTCCGVARGFSAKACQKLFFKDTAGEDAYSYLEIVRQKLTYIHLRELCVFFELPKNWIDHRNQSVRALVTTQILNKDFDIKLVQQETAIPKDIITSEYFKWVFISPIKINLYIFLLFINIFYQLYLDIFYKSRRFDYVPSRSTKNTN